MKKIVFPLVFTISSCVSAQPDDLRDYPDGFLCRLLDPNQYISSPQEQINIYRELERRNLACQPGGAVINQTVVVNN